MDSTASSRYDLCIDRNHLSNRVSLTVNIRQALKAEDVRQVLLLITQADVKTISATAKELLSPEAAELLDHLSKFLSVDARRMGVVIEWVREIVLAHAPYLASQSSTQLKLRPILDFLNQRISDHSELVHMKQVTNAIIRNASSNEVSTPTNVVETQEPVMRWSPE
jgi:hypothetical protein